jgi:hypothetical protein
MCESIVARSERIEAMQRLLQSMPSACDEHEARESSPAVEVWTEPSEPSSATRSEPNESTFSGDLGEFRLPELLELLRAGRRSGTLTCQAPCGIGGFKLRNGNIVRARYRSLNPDQEPSLPPPTMRLDQPRPRSRTEVKRQATDVVLQVIYWEEGQFCFEPADASAPDESDLETDSQGILLDVFRQLDAASSGQQRAKGSSE